MVAKKSGLGKGLDALIPAGNKKAPVKKETEPVIIEKIVEKKGVETLKITEVEPNREQPRKNFNEDALLELSDSIKQYGVIQPLIVQKKGDHYEIIAGERRWRAAKMAGIKEIPVIIKDYSDQQVMEISLIENIQREDLNPIEEAEGIRQMIETYGLTQEEVSKSVGKSRPYIANSLRLLRLPETVRKYVEDGSLSTGHAKAIAAVSDKKKQIELAEVAIRDGLSVRQLEKLAQQDKSGVKTRSRVKQKTADVKRVEEDLKNALGTKVTLNQKGKKGKIEIEFYSKDELERLIELLKKLG